MSAALEAMRSHAESYLRSARANLAQGPQQSSVAFDEARHAAEVSAKALYLAKTGTELGKVHNIGGTLAHTGLIPADLDEKAVARLFAEHTRGSYGYYDDIGRAEIEAAIHVAQTFMASTLAGRKARFHPSRPQS